MQHWKTWEKLEKIPAWQLTKVRNKEEVIEEARNNGRKVHSASLMDLCHLKNSELEPQYQKYNGRVALRGDIVKDDPGSYAVFTEHGSSASQMTAAKVMDIISRLLGWAGEAADAVSAKTHVKMKDAPTLLKIPKSECPDIWIRLPRHKIAKIMVLLWERQLAKFYWNIVGKKFRIVNVHSLTGKKGFSHVCMWTVQNCLERHRKSIRLGKFLWKTLIWVNQHDFLTMFIWIALKENVSLARILWIIAEACSKQGFLPGLGKITRNTSHAETWCRNDIFLVLWHGRSCKEMRGKILRIGE